MKLASRSKIHWLNSEICGPELVVHSFVVGAGVILIQGNLHIRVPHEARVSRNLRSRIVKEALKTLETEAPNDSAAQPVVLVLVGDCNLLPEQAEGHTNIATCGGRLANSVASASHHKTAERRSDFREGRPCQ